MKTIRLTALALFCILCSSCSISMTSQKVRRQSSLEGYKYFYISPAEKKAHTTYSINPENIIEERLEKKGYRKMPELKQENLDKSIIIKYKETARRNKAKVNVEFISADTHKILCKGRAKGHGTKDEAKKAICKSLDAFFK